MRCGGAHTNVLAGSTLASCQMPLIGTAGKSDTLGRRKKKAGEYNEPRFCCEKLFFFPTSDPVIS